MKEAGGGEKRREEKRRERKRERERERELTSAFAPRMFICHFFSLPSAPLRFPPLSLLPNLSSFFLSFLPSFYCCLQ